MLLDLLIASVPKPFYELKLQFLLKGQPMV